MQKQSRAASALMAALDRFHNHDGELVIAVQHGSDVANLRRDVFQTYRPNRTLVWVVDEQIHDDPVHHQSPIAMELVEGKTAGQHATVVYQCQGFQCDAPVADPSPDFWNSSSMSQ